MPIPDFQNLMLPMLQLAADGKEHRLSDAIEALAQQYQLSDEDRAELLPSGRQARFDNKVGWARTHLGKAGLLANSRRGWFHITEQGRALLADPPERITVAFLMRYPEYAAFRSQAAPANTDEEGVPPTEEVTGEFPAVPEPMLRRLTAIDAAYHVLSEAGVPLHSHEIAQRMIVQVSFIALYCTDTGGNTAQSSAIVHRPEIVGNRAQRDVAGAAAHLTLPPPDHRLSFPQHSCLCGRTYGWEEHSLARPS